MNVDKLIKKASTLGGDINWIKLTDGINTLRIVCREGDEEPWRECFRHFLQRHIQMESFRNKAPTCLGDISVCPACQFVEQLRQQGKDKEADMARAQRRFIFAALSRDTPYNEGGEVCVKLLECAPTVFQGLGKVAQEWNLDFTDPDQGCDLEIVRNSQSGGGFTKYEVRPQTTLVEGSKSVIKKPLTPQEKQLIREAFPDFDAQTSPPDPVELAAALGVSIGEPEVMPPSAQPPVADVSSVPSQPAASTQEIPEEECMLYGEGWEDDDSCRECTLAQDCKQLTEIKQRKPIKKPQ